MAGRIALAISAAVFMVASVSAQSAADASTQVDRVEAAYENLAYDEAEALARTALTNFEAFSPGQLVRLHTTLALILYARGEDLEAAEQFRAALTLNPALVLDPVLVSPVTMAFFEEAKSTFFRERETETGGEGSIRYVQLTDNRPPATWRSALLPGWGQRYKGQSGAGWLLTGAWVGTFGGGVFAHLQRKNAHDAYLAETDPDLIEEKFNTFNTWHKVRGGLFAGAAAVWVYSAADALISGGPESPLEFSPAPGGFSVSYRF